MVPSGGFQRIDYATFPACVKARTWPVEFGLPPPLVSIGKREVEFHAVASTAVVDRGKPRSSAMQTLGELTAELFKTFVFRVLVCFKPRPIEHGPVPPKLFGSTAMTLNYVAIHCLNRIAS